MHEVKCPHCGKTFTIDEAGYADIVKQVRDSEFESQLHERLELAEEDQKKALELVETKAANDARQAVAAKDAQIQGLKAKLDAGELQQKLAVKDALASVEKERDTLALEVERVKQENALAVELAEATAAVRLQKDVATKEALRS